MHRFRKTIRHPEMLGRKGSKASDAVYDHRVDLHGMTCNEAESELNRMFSSFTGTVLIIHGKGSGTLRLHVRSFLSKDSRVKKVKYGEDESILGGDGVTLVYL